MNRAVFLDRDNTLIHNDGDLGDPADVKLIQGAASAIASLRGLGYRVIVVTNQGGVARGKYTEADVDRVNARINERVRASTGAFIDRFYSCPFHPDAVVEQFRGDHPWRKPNPGMLKQAAEDFKLDLASCWMIGDAMRDVQAGRRAGVRTVLISDAAEPPTADDGTTPDFIAKNLTEAVRLIAQQPRTAAASLAPARRAGLSGEEEARGEEEVRGQKSEVRGQISEAGATAVVEAPASIAPAEPEEFNDTPVDLLRQIARELKAQRVERGDFSYSRMLAALFQMVAAGCAMFALTELHRPGAAAAWLLGAIFVQLIVITLIVARP